MSKDVGQVCNLRPIGNRPPDETDMVAVYGTDNGRPNRRIANPPQDAILPHINK